MRRQELHCWNCGEDGHGMYFCPQPRRYAGNNQGRGPARQVTPPRDRPQAPAPPPPPIVPQQVLRRPPQPVAEVPPLPEEAGERAVNVIQLESKGKEKVAEPEIVAVKRTAAKKARYSEEARGPPSSMDIEEEGTSKSAKRKKRTSSRRKITIKDFQLGMKEEPYDLVKDVSSQGPNLSWPQFLHLSPKMRWQW